MSLVQKCCNRKAIYEITYDGDKLGDQVIQVCKFHYKDDIFRKFVKSIKSKAEATSEIRHIDQRSDGHIYIGNMRRDLVEKQKTNRLFEIQDFETYRKALDAIEEFTPKSKKGIKK